MPAARRVADSVWQVTAGAFVSNSYIWQNSSTGELLLIDTGLDAGPISDAIDAIGGAPVAVVCTHGHFDHMGTAAIFQRRYGIEVFLHTADTKIAKTANFLLMAFKIPAKVETPSFTLFDGKTGSLSLAGVTVGYRHVPGHTPGSCFIEVNDNCFTGDTLYASGVGLSKTPGEQPDLLRASLIEVMDDIPPETLICPGHGLAAPFRDVRAGNEPLRRFLHLEGAEG